MAQFSGSTYSAAVDESKRLISLATLGNTQVDMSNYYSKTDSDNKFAAKVDLDTLTTSVNDKINTTDIVDNLTSTDTDKPLSANQGKMLKDEVDLKANDNDVVKKTDIVTTIDSSSTNDTVPSAKAVNELNIRGTLIDQSVIDKYGTEITKYPLGRWYFESNSVAEQFSDIPWSEACIIEIYNTGNPWNSTWSYRNYKAQYTTNKGIFVRQLESRDTAGVLVDTGWQRVYTTSVEDVPRTELDMPTLTEGRFENAFSGNISNYSVKNGVCTLTLTVKCVTPISNLDTTIGSKILPKSANGIVYAFGFDRNMSTSTNPIMIQVDTYGNLLFGGGTTGGNYRLTFSYPVAES